MKVLSVTLLSFTMTASAAAQTTDSAVTRFYQARWWRPAWVEANTIGPDAEQLMWTLSLAHRDGLDPDDYFPAAVDSLLHKHLSPDEAWRLDTLLTLAFLRYARDVSIGRVEPARVDSQWLAAPRDWDAAAVLAHALDEHQVGAALGRLAPSQPGYVALREALRRYRDLAARGDWPRSVRHRLASEGYDTAAGVTEAVRRFQVLHGLTPDGIVGPETRAQLDITPAARARQIELNLERWRWQPPILGDRYIVVNSAAFVVELVEHDTVRFSARAVVGRTDWPTPITSSRATDIVFRPVWKVPRAIAVQELLPLIQRDPEYFTRAGFRVFSDSLDTEVDPRDVAWTSLTDSTFAYHLEQEPGPENPLGGLKLVFWTPFSVFIHDTPSRSSFSERWRNFSHGCIRVEHADQLAALLLTDWPADSIQAAMTTGRQRWVRLPSSIPVHIAYWTAWVAEDGLVAFADDPYRWDEKLAQALDARSAERITMEGAGASARRCAARL